MERSIPENIRGEQKFNLEDRYIKYALYYHKLGIKPNYKPSTNIRHAIGGMVGLVATMGIVSEIMNRRRNTRATITRRNEDVEEYENGTRI